MLVAHTCTDSVTYRTYCEKKFKHALRLFQTWKHLKGILKNSKLIKKTRVRNRRFIYNLLPKRERIGVTTTRCMRCELIYAPWQEVQIYGITSPPTHLPSNTPLLIVWFPQGKILYPTAVNKILNPQTFTYSAQSIGRIFQFKSKKTKQV